MWTTAQPWLETWAPPHCTDVQSSSMWGLGWVRPPASHRPLSIHAAFPARRARLPFWHRHDDFPYVTQQAIQRVHKLKWKEN